ncbi:MAG TPA: hypothetical protein VI913_01665 [Candidatus Peribacteraceae bacterium]|nr:hypothetical protein [Candidatus Peribacteraceae bacterium]
MPDITLHDVMAHISKMKFDLENKLHTIHLDLKRDIEAVHEHSRGNADGIDILANRLTKVERRMHRWK